MDQFGFLMTAGLKSSFPAFALAIPFFILFLALPFILAWGRYLFGDRFLSFFGGEDLPIDSLKHFIFAIVFLCVLLLFIPFITPFSSNILAFIFFIGVMFLWWRIVNSGYKAFGLKKGALFSVLFFFVFYGDALLADTLRFHYKRAPSVEVYDPDAATTILTIMQENEFRRIASSRWGTPIEFPLKSGKVILLSGRRPVSLYNYYAYVTPREHTRIYSLTYISCYVCFFHVRAENPIFCYRIRDVQGSWLLSILPPFVFDLAKNI